MAATCCFIGKLKELTRGIPTVLLPVVILCGCRAEPRPPTPRALEQANTLSASQPLAGVDALAQRSYVAPIDATAAPPAGWQSDPLKSTSEHNHLAWISPSGHTAYGIIRFKLPLPIGHDWALAGFLNNMKKSQGEATLIARQWDPAIKGLRFIAQGGQYTLRSNLFVRGTTGWAVYAGTLRQENVNSAELALAEEARERTMIGSDSDPRHVQDSIQTAGRH
jgi:hypothetical protein